MDCLTADVYRFDKCPDWDGFRQILHHGPVRLRLGFSEGTHHLALWIQAEHFSEVVERSESLLDSLCCVVSSDASHGVTVWIELLDSALQAPFLSFCRDFKILLQYTSEGEDFLHIIRNRIRDWRVLLKCRKEWSLQRVKGLVTELVYLRDFLAPRIGFERAVVAWEGPRGGDQDFQTPEGWIEVKSTVSGNNHVRISSVEQLDSSVPGHLAVFSMDKSSKTSEDALVLSQIVEDIRSNLVNTQPATRRLFEDLLNLVHYETCHNASMYAFRRRELRIYRVGPDDFPCVRQKQLPSGVESLTYVLDLNVLDAFKE